MNKVTNKNVAKSLLEIASINNAETFPRYQTPFVDYKRIRCKAGHGGSPLANINRSRKLNGPGYGGHGGDIILKSTHLVEDLLHLEEEIVAKHGCDASGTSRGLHAPHHIVNVPIGLILRKRIESRSIFWHQFMNSNEYIVVARGGKGGLGPSYFKKHDHRLPEVGEITNIELELRLFNDATLIGLPNSGKTSLLTSLTSYMTRIGPEEGSTTRPHVAIIKFIDGVDIRVLDLPPICPNDMESLKRTLRHIYRSKLLVYVIDATNSTEQTNTFHLLRDVVTKSPMYNENKLELVVMTKCDQVHKETLFNLDEMYYKLLVTHPQIRVIGTSATHRLGLDRCARTIRDMLQPEDLTYYRRRFVESYETNLLERSKSLKCD